MLDRAGAANGLTTSYGVTVATVHGKPIAYLVHCLQVNLCLG